MKCLHVKDMVHPGFYLHLKSNDDEKFKLDIGISNMSQLIKEVVKKRYSLKES